MEDLQKEMECLQIMVVTLMKKVDTFKFKVDDIEIKVKLVIDDVLKEVYGLSDPSPANTSEGMHTDDPQDQIMGDSAKKKDEAVENEQVARENVENAASDKEI